MKKGEWTFLSNHGLVLAYIAKHPESTLRQISDAISITEWTVHKIIGELEEKGYLERRRVGRRNVYIINFHLHLRHATIQNTVVGNLLATLGWDRGEHLADIANPG